MLSDKKLIGNNRPNCRHLSEPATVRGMAISDRQLQDEERKLIAYLWGLRASGNALPPEIRVRELEDGGMGSLSFVSSKLRRSIGQVAGECSFPDADGVLVVAALLLDEDGDLYELDLWKVDFAPLIRIPDPASFSPLRDAPNDG